MLRFSPSLQTPFLLPLLPLQIHSIPSTRQQKVQGGRLWSVHSGFTPLFLSSPIFLLLQCGFSMGCNFLQEYPAALLWGPPSTGCSVDICSGDWSTSSSSSDFALCTAASHFFFFNFSSACSVFFRLLKHIITEAPPASLMGSAVASGRSARAEWRRLVWHGAARSQMPSLPPPSCQPLAIYTQHTILLWHPNICFKMDLYGEKNKKYKKRYLNVVEGDFWDKSTGLLLPLPNKYCSISPYSTTYN